MLCLPLEISNGSRKEPGYGSSYLDHEGKRVESRKFRTKARLSLRFMDQSFHNV